MMISIPRFIQRQQLSLRLTGPLLTGPLLTGLLLTGTLLSSLPLMAEPGDDESTEDELPFVSIQYVKDFSQLAASASQSHDRGRGQSSGQNRGQGKVQGNRIILLEASASYCDYCDLLEEEFIKPMLRNSDYDDVLIRKIDIDSYHPIKDFSGDSTSPDEFARSLNIILTPTLLFFDADGNEVAARILGINSIELYGGYLDDALATGIANIRQREVRSD